MLWIAVIFLAGHPVLMGTALVISLFDTGGPHWGVVWLTFVLFSMLFRRRRDPTEPTEIAKSDGA